MSSNKDSALGKVNLRAITGEEVKEIAIHEITKAIRKLPQIKKFLTFHNFKMRWAFSITALADTPVPPEIEGTMNISARDITDEEIAEIRGNLEKLKAKKESLAPLATRLQLLDKYISEAEVIVVEKGEISDNRRPDVLRQEVGLPVLSVQRVGPRLAEVPIEQPPVEIQSPNPFIDSVVGKNGNEGEEEEVKIDI